MPPPLGELHFPHPGARHKTKKKKKKGKSNDVEDMELGERRSRSTYG